METRQFNDKRQLVDYDKFVAFGDEAVVVCVPKAALQVARVLVRERGYWRSTYTKGAVNNYEYEIPSIAEMDVVEEVLAEFLSETEVFTMPICDDIVSELSALNATLGSLDLSCITNVSGGGEGCGPGSGGAGSGEAEETTEVDDGATPPEGFSTYTEYQSHKCNMAEKIRQDLIHDLTWLKGATILTISAEAIIGAFFLPVPGARVVSLLGFAISLITQGLIITTCDEIINSLNTNAEALRCCLYDAYDVGEAETCFTSTLGLGVLAQTLLGYFTDADNLNRLFEPEGIGDYGVNCSTCDVNDLELWLGTTSDDLLYDTPITINPVNISGIWRVQIGIHQNDCSSLTNIQILQNTAGSGPQSSGNTYTWNTCTTWNTVPQGEVIPVGNYSPFMGVSQIAPANFAFQVQFDRP